MRLFRRGMRGDSGFTLIEMVAAMAIFAMAAAAVLSVLVTGIRTAGVARNRTQAKEVARGQLEEMRRLPFYHDYSTFSSRCATPGCDAARVDLLDRYLPDLGDPDGVGGPAGYSDATATYTVFQTGNVGTFAYQMYIRSRFVGEDLRPTGTKRIETITPCGRFLSEGVACTGYTWTSDTAGKPPSYLLGTEIEVRWGPGFRQSFSLRSQLGEPRLTRVVLRGAADGTVVEADTAFFDRSTLAVGGGLASSSIFVGDVATARNESQSGNVTLGLEDGTTSGIEAAKAVAAAPPDAGPINPADSSPQSFVHPNSSLLSLPAACGTSCIATVSAGRVENVSAATAPSSTGRLILAPTGLDTDDISGSGVRGLTATNQVGTDFRSLDTTKMFVSAIRKNGRAISLESSCGTTSTTVTCRTQNPTSFNTLAGLRLMPVTLGLPGDTNGYLVQVELDDARAVATTGTSTGAAVAEVVYAGRVKYWERAGGGWLLQTVNITNGGANTLPNPADVRLNDLGTLTLADYILSWNAAPAIAAQILDNGRTVIASVSGIFSMVTKPTNITPGYENSGFIIGVGNLRAEAVDRR